MPGGVGVGAGAGVAGAGACDDAGARVVVGATKRVAEGPEIDMIVYGPLDWEQSCSRREKKPWRMLAVQNAFKRWPGNRPTDFLRLGPTAERAELAEGMH